MDLTLVSAVFDPAMIPGESSPAQRAPDHDRDQVPSADDAENLDRYEHAEMADAIERSGMRDDCA
jgi:hypothetical protein